MANERAITAPPSRAAVQRTSVCGTAGWRSDYRSVHSTVMDLRIGVTQSPRELSIELADDTDRVELQKKIDAALSGAVDVLWVTDKKQRDVGVVAAKIAFVEIGSAEGERKIGFGG